MIPLLQVEYWNTMAQPETWIVYAILLLGVVMRPFWSGFALVILLTTFVFCTLAVGTWFGMFETAIPIRSGDFAFAFFQTMLLESARFLGFVAVAIVALMARHLFLRVNTGKVAL